MLLSHEMLFAMQKTDFHVLELFCKASHIRASMHRITNLELLRTLMLCLVQLSKFRECKATDAEKLLSQWEKVAKCNFRSNALARPRMLKASSQWVKVANCNYKSKALVHERCFFSWNEMLFAMQKTDFHLLELFCKASHIRASMHRITNLELLRTLLLCLVQQSKWRECKAMDAEKLLSQWEKVVKCNFMNKALARPRMLKSFFLSERKFLNAILRVKLKYMKDVFFSWNEMSFAMQKTDFHVLELFCKASHIRASMHRITSLELLRTLMLCLCN